MVNYEGTNELNPAFKSRFVTIEYNYVPQKITGSLEDQEFPEKNELFRIIITRLADKNGNIHIPDSKRTLEELFRFSQLCRVTQNIFMGNWKENEVQKDFGTDEPELRESVLSIRNILHVLDNFDQMPDVKGQVKVTRIHTEHDFYEFGRCLEISNGLFVVENGDEKLNLFEIVKEKKINIVLFFIKIYIALFPIGLHWKK
ncbi:MAG: hypothetical protein PHT78_09265 [Desulfitobacteriaceae bacterium]|nr:hypothetical protein [Desulfitobacteriaceae bacterium]